MNVTFRVLGEEKNSMNRINVRSEYIFHKGDQVRCIASMGMQDGCYKNIYQLSTQIRGLISLHINHLQINLFYQHGFLKLIRLLLGFKVHFSTVFVKLARNYGQNFDIKKTNLVSPFNETPINPLK